MKTRTVKCSTHGAGLWRQTIVCADCERVYQVVVEGQKFVPICPGAARAPERCECGSMLAGDGGSARVCCTKCFKARTLQ